MHHVVYHDLRYSSLSAHSSQTHLPNWTNTVAGATVQVLTY